MADYFSARDILEKAIGTDAYFQIKSVLFGLKVADVVEVRHGRWERRNMGLWDEDYAYACSACGEVWTLIDGTPEDNNMNYCPNCGARMGKEAEHEVS